MRNHYFRQIDLLLCTLYSVNTTHTNSTVSVVIEIIHQLVQNKNFSPYVISQLSHMHIHFHTRIWLSENLPVLISIAKHKIGNQYAWLLTKHSSVLGRL